MNQPLLTRKETLQSSVRENGLIAISRYIPTDGIGMFRAANEKELEGVVAKRASSLYYTIMMVLSRQAYKGLDQIQVDGR